MTESTQFLGIKWMGGTPKFMVTGSAGDIEFLDIPGHLNLTKTSAKKCVGYYDLAARKYMPCPLRVDLTDADIAQCADCRDANGFGMCLGCNGDACRADNPRGRVFCAQEHMVYLAHFPGRFKVGTAAAYRDMERMLEQGALVSIFFARTPDGRTARRIEQAVSDLGITKSVNANYKINNLVFTSGIDTACGDLIKKLNEIRPKISPDLAQYFTEPKINVFTDIYEKLADCMTEARTTDLFGAPIIAVKDYDRIMDTDQIIGDVKSVVGEILVIENGGKLYAVNMKNWQGFMVNIND